MSRYTALDFTECLKVLELQLFADIEDEYIVPECGNCHFHAECETLSTACASDMGLFEFKANFTKNYRKNEISETGCRLRTNTKNTGMK